MGAFNVEGELGRMRANLAQREAERQRRRAERLEAARADFDRVVAHIARVYAPTRIYQWGSLLDGAHFDERSDIDIALEGVTDAAAFFALLADAENLTTFSLDIVQLETIHQEFAKSIRARGRVVYQR